MDTPNQFFHLYVKSVGGRTEAAKRLGLSVGMVGHILCGRRPISVKTALAIEADTKGLFKRSVLRPDLWPSGHE